MTEELSDGSVSDRNDDAIGPFRLMSGNVVYSQADAVCVTTNCRGVAGAGLARQFRDAFPEWYDWYRKLCVSEQRQRFIYPGSMVPFISTLRQRWILTCNTKDHWKQPSRIEWQISIMREIVRFVDMFPMVHSVALVPLGAGLGGLDVRVVVDHMSKRVSASERDDVDWQLWGYVDGQ